jgi:hypothetical protein
MYAYVCAECHITVGGGVGRESAVVMVVVMVVVLGDRMSFNIDILSVKAYLRYCS